MAARKQSKPKKKPIRAYDPPMRLSQALDELAHDASRDRVSVGDLLSLMHHRAIAALMFVFAFPNILPTIPGFSTLFSLPLMVLSVQLAFGLNPWLPKAITKRSLSQKQAKSLIRKINPWLLKAETYIKPRASFLAVQPFEFLVGISCLFMAMIIFLPIPFGNLLPAVSVCLFSLGVLGRDGAWILGGFAFMGLSILIVGGVAYAFVKAALFLASNVF